MLTIANIFVLGLLGAAAWVATAALVEKRTRRRRNLADRSTNAAS